jgi:flagellar biosynthetic protein FliP
MASALGLISALAIVGGLLLLTLRLLRRLHGGGGSGRVPVELVQRQALGPKQSLAVVRVGSRVLVLATSDHGARLLTELEGVDREAVLGDAPAPSRRDPELRRLLSRLTLVLALVVAAPAAAQAPPPPPPPQLERPARSTPLTLPRPAAPAPAAGSRPEAPTVRAPDEPDIEVKIGQGAEQLRLSGTVGLVVFLGGLTLLPAVVLLMTSFTRIVVVLHFLRSALGTQGSPPGQLLVAIAVLLTGVVMRPVLSEVNQAAVQPYLAGQIEQAEAYRRGLDPFRRFMLANVREKDLGTFTELSGAERADSVEALPTLTIMSAFVTSELQSAFWMGFVIFLPFVVVDLVVATALMSLGMFMVPPVMISLPFKLLLFVLADGWSLVAQNLVASFRW